MISFGVLIWISVVTVFTSSSSASGLCDKIANVNWALGDSVESLKTCYMQTTPIYSPDFLITSDRDETIKAFWTGNNTKLEYLPKNLGEKLPNLIILDARECSIKEIRKENFRGLGKLRELLLDNNQIVKIDEDTFEYIPAVERILLEHNNITKLNSHAFTSLSKLNYVDVEGNDCINEYFNGAAAIAGMSRVLAEKCGFETSSTKIAKLEAELDAQSKKLQAVLNSHAKLETQAELQIVRHFKIEAQREEAGNARIELKVQEVSNLSNDLQAKNAEISEKNEKIEQLEKKNQILVGDGDGPW